MAPLGTEGPFADMPSDLTGRQTQEWMKVPFKWLLSSWNQKELLRAQVNEPWCNRRQAATSETKHKPRFLPEYSTKGMGSHRTHFQGAMCWFLMFLYLGQMFWPLCVRLYFSLSYVCDCFISLFSPRAWLGGRVGHCVPLGLYNQTDYGLKLRWVC